MCASPLVLAPRPQKRNTHLASTLGALWAYRSHVGLDASLNSIGIATLNSPAIRCGGFVRRSSEETMLLERYHTANTLGYGTEPTCDGRKNGRINCVLSRSIRRPGSAWTL